MKAISLNTVAALSILLTTALPAAAETLQAPMAASNVRLDEPTQPYATIWADELPSIRASRELVIQNAGDAGLKLETELFAATIQSGDATYILSAFNDGCAVSEASPDELDCTAKLTRIEGDRIEQVATIPEFPILAKRGDTGFQGADPSFNTTLQLNTETNALSYVTIENNTPSDPVPLP